MTVGRSSFKLIYSEGQCSQLVAPNFGTGFYLKVPDSQKNVILTAGHNLIDENKVRTKSLKITTANGKSIPFDPKEVFYQNHEEFTSDNKEANDWGMILVPKNKDIPDIGFEFSLLFATAQSTSCGSLMDLTLVGYHPVPSDCLGLVMSSGKGQQISEDQLEYAIRTKRGQSGSPIIIAHNGYPTVIGIQ
jgi:V8-like Glu-specific endopeptidase